MKRYLVKLIDPKGRVRHTREGPTRRYQGSQDIEGQRELCTRGFIVVSMRRNGRGRVSRFKIVSSESLQQALGDRGCPYLFGNWPCGD